MREFISNVCTSFILLKIGSASVWFYLATDCTDLHRLTNTTILFCENPCNPWQKVKSGALPKSLN